MGDLLWGDRTPAAKGPKRTLDVDRIVAEAIAIADADGLAALSMNALATRLGVGTMSLYRYVASKDELLELIVDAAAGAPPQLPADLTWRETFTRWAAASLDMYDRHPWTLQALGMPRRMGPNELAWSEVGFAAAQRAGASGTDIYDVIMTVSSYVRGAAQLSARPGHGPALDVPAIIANGGLERFPMLAVVLDSASDDGDLRRHFDFGLRRVLDGIELHLNGRK